MVMVLLRYNYTPNNYTIDHTGCSAEAFLDVTYNYIKKVIPAG